jgi:Leucine-rich repeat (LRR) protein
MTALATFDLSFNAMTGSLPATMCALKSTTKVQLQNNAFSGMLPPGIFNGMSSLELLNLSTNQLSGELPADLSVLTALNVLDISSNQFIGDLAKVLVPPFAPALLRLAGNLFSGKLHSFPRWQQNISTKKFQIGIDCA